MLPCSKPSLTLYRWNSTYDMLVRAIRLRGPLDHFLWEEKGYYENLVKKGKKKTLMEKGDDSVTQFVFKHIPSSTDWAVITEIGEILEPFKEATKKLEGRPDGSSSSG